jgi:hypothetical protein
MGQDTDVAENRWLREAMQHAVPFTYFLGQTAARPGRTGSC